MAGSAVLPARVGHWRVGESDVNEDSWRHGGSKGESVMSSVRLLQHVSAHLKRDSRSTQADGR